MENDNKEATPPAAVETHEEPKKQPDKYDSLAAHVRKSNERMTAELASIKEMMAEAKASGTSTPELEQDVKVQVKEYKKEFDKLTRTLNEERRAAQAERDRAQVVGTINELGVMGTEILYNHFSAKNMVAKNDDGEFVFRAEKNGVERPLKDGLKEWLTTQEGKMFMPPSGVSGSGATQRPGLAAHKQDVKLTKTERKEQAMSAFLEMTRLK